MSIEPPPIVDSTALALTGRYARLQLERDGATRTFSRGVALLISGPVGVLVASPLASLLGTYTPLFLTAIYAVLATAGGISMMAVSALQQRTLARRLRALDDARLPAARLLR